MNLDALPYIPARDQSDRPAGYRLKWITIHDMEAPESLTTAEGTANYFRNPGSRTASAHYCCDADSTVCCVKPERRAVHAAGLNNEGIGIEQAGYARQTREEWLDDFSKRMITEQVAPLIAALCKRYQIPCDYVGADGLKAGRSGIVTHYDSTVAFNVKGGHTDPGPNYPMDLLVATARTFLNPPPPAQKEDEMVTDELLRNPATGAVYLATTTKNTDGTFSWLKRAVWLADNDAVTFLTKNAGLKLRDANPVELSLIAVDPNARHHLDR